MIHFIVRTYNFLNLFATNHPGVLFLITTAAIFAMPAKDAQFNWRTLYAFFFDWFHGIIGLRSGTATSTVVRTPDTTVSSTSTPTNK